MPLKLSELPRGDIKVHLIDKKDDNYFDDELNVYVDGPLPGGGVTQGYVDEQDALTLASAKTYTDEEIAKAVVTKLYTGYGQNTDGAVTQKFFTDEMNSVEAKLQDIVPVQTAVVLEDIRATADSSTITLDKVLVNILNSTESNENLTLPVASDRQAGVLNTATYNTIQSNSRSIDAILNGAVAVTGISSTVTQAELTNLWKTTTSQTELINQASIYDIDNKVVWHYFTNTSTWYADKADGGSVTVSQATNESLGIVKGSETDGQIFVETDGSMSVNGWDALKEMVETDNVRVSNLPTQVFYNTSLTAYNSDNVELNLVLKDLHTGGDATKALRIDGATPTQAGVMSTAQASKLDGLLTVKSVNDSLVLDGDGQLSVPTMTVSEFNTAWNNAQ